MTPKDALRKYNKENPADAVPFKEGQGRLSRAAVAKCAELAGKGWSINGYVATPDKSTVVAGQPAPVVVKKVAVVNEKVISDFVIKYDEKLYKAVDKGGKVWSMREACNNCMVSLVQCHCDAPTILGNIGLTIVRQ